MNKNDLLEKLAALEHEQWCEWAYTVMKEEEISQKRIERWNHLLTTSYENLSEEEKEKDREWARQVIYIFQTFEGRKIKYG